MAERIRYAIESNPLQYKRCTISVTASLGVAAIEKSIATSKSYMRHVQRIIKQADEALYQAKAAGKNQVLAAP